MAELRLAHLHEIEKDRCEKCDGKRPIFKNGAEYCGVCYGIKKGYFADPENDPAVRETFERGWMSDGGGEASDV